ncbi:hypothetical protein C8J57DRAFT_1357875 [Mycena rebaudengoi]|nr:hypothetical protein C8J57DRAFT_1357875 [Mycena rebaudengoi]
MSEDQLQVSGRDSTAAVDFKKGSLGSGACRARGAGRGVRALAQARGGQYERGMVEGASCLSLVVSTSALDPPRVAHVERAMSSGTPMSTRLPNLTRPRVPLARGRRVRTSARRGAGCVDPLGAKRGRGNPRASRTTEVWVSATRPSGVSARRVREAMAGSTGRAERTRAVSVLNGTGFGVCLELSAYRIYDAPSPLTPSTFAAVY